jgi:putative methionine-R-sulfoxide reductase with GAF domain
LEYKKAKKQIKSITKNSSDVLLDVVDFLCNNFKYYSWVGIYIIQGNDLVLGPWKGPNITEHTRITVGKGICGSAAKTGKTEVVDDVHSDNRYLACFVSTKSEIVVPIKKEGKIVGEIDIDSDKIGAFTIKDKIFLEKIADMLSEHI